MRLSKGRKYKKGKETCCVGVCGVVAGTPRLPPVVYLFYFPINSRECGSRES